MSNSLATPVDCSPPGSSVHGSPQAMLDWAAISFSRGSSQPRSPVFHMDSLLTEPLEKPEFPLGHDSRQLSWLIALWLQDPCLLKWQAAFFVHTSYQIAAFPLFMTFPHRRKLYILETIVKLLVSLIFSIWVVQRMVSNLFTVRLLSSFFSHSWLLV